MKIILITGRSLKQGILVDGKKNEMHKILDFCEMNSEDMKKIKVKDGDTVILQNENRKITLKVKASENLPKGVIFAPLTPKINKIILYNNSKRGISSGKGVSIDIFKN
ncbi:MAG: molybdopterin dinucleotide binding domain-containing protein [Candidatus Odinarchaeia archaeon]